MTRKPRVKTKTPQKARKKRETEEAIILRAERILVREMLGGKGPAPHARWTA